VKIAAVLAGEPASDDLNNDPNLIANFRCAPATSVDCERAFSHFKDLLSSKRLRLTESHLRDQMIVSWNSALI